MKLSNVVVGIVSAYNPTILPFYCFVCEKQSAMRDWYDNLDKQDCYLHSDTTLFL